MGTITSGIGLISGIDFTTLIDQLLTIDAAPRDRLLARMGSIDAQRTAYLDISARISAILSHASTLSSSSFFTSSKVSSSDADVLSATVGDNAVPGSYNFIVRSLATTHQLVSRGYRSRDAQLSPGSVTIESAQARVNARTKLDELNGYSGVHRGSFEIIDGEDNRATINLADAVTLADVLDKINEAGINVSAEVRGEGLVLTETTGSALRVRDLNGGHAAADLGFGPGKTYDSGGRIDGNDLVYLADVTPLSALNDGMGIRRVQAGGDFSINDLAVDLSEILTGDTRLERLNHGHGVDLGQIRVTAVDDAGVEREHEIDLSGLSTVGQVKDAIEGSLEGVTVTLADNRMIVSYSETEDGEERLLEIEDVSGNAARDLGIEGESEFGKINGDGILFVDTIGDVVNAINYATENDGSVTASIDGTRLVINGGATVDLVALNDSKALLDLGFVEGARDGPLSGRRLIRGIDGALLSSLNGGQGFEPGRINIQVGESSVTLDLTGLETMSQVIERINEASVAEELGIEAGFDHTGRRLVVSSIDGLAEISISDAAGYGSFATDIGLAQEDPSTEVRSDDLQLQYISESTRLADLRGGRGIALGKIDITDSAGQSATIDFTEGQFETLQDVIDKINSATNGSGDPLGIAARINDTGDGLVVEDTAGGSFTMKIEDKSGTGASDLNIVGEHESGIADGSYEISVDLAGSETLEDLVRKINEHGGLVTASILNDGTDIAPYRLEVSSTAMGSAGELLVDGLDFTTLSTAQDAKVILGNDAGSGLLITSSSNTLTDVVPGLTIDLTGVSDDPITVTISRDTDTIVETFQGFVSSFNSAIDRIDELGSYDAETEARGILLGEGTLRMIEGRLFDMVIGRLPGASGNIRRLSDVGIGLKNGKLELDENKLQEAMEDHFDEVVEFFSEVESGMAPLMKEQLEAITESGDGLIDRRGNTLEKQREQLSDRVDLLNERLESKRDRLMRQFMSMESALAAMQTQMDSLNQLSTLSGSWGSG